MPTAFKLVVVEEEVEAAEEEDYHGVQCSCASKRQKHSKPQFGSTSTRRDTPRGTKFLFYICLSQSSMYLPSVKVSEIFRQPAFNSSHDRGKVLSLVGRAITVLNSRIL